MTLQETMQRIAGLQHLTGNKVPRWNTPILEIIPVPATADFDKFIKTFSKTGDFNRSMKGIKSTEFDILLVFMTPKLHGSLVCEWYSFFY